MTLIADDCDRVNVHVPQTWDALRGARIFVTGGTGFFGTWLLESLVRANATHGIGASAVVLTRDADAFRRKAPHLAADPAITLHVGDVRTFAHPEGAFTHVVHGATSSRASHYESAPREMFDTIVDGTRRVLDFAVERGIPRVLLVSSGAVYGRQPPELTHVPETFLGGPDPLDPNNAYAEGKRAAELLGVLATRMPNGPAVTIARCFAFVGPHLPLDAHFAIGNFIRDAIAGGPIRLTGDGSPWRSYLYAADLAAWLWTILARGEAGRAYNVGSPRAENLWDTARAVARVAAIVDVQRAAVPNDQVPTARYVPDVERAQRELVLDAWTTLDGAIARTIAWQRGEHATRPCPVCDGYRRDVLHAQRFVLPEGHRLDAPYDVVACVDCGFVFADTPLRQTDYDAYYADGSKYADAQTGTGAGVQPWDDERLRATADTISWYAPHDARIVDVGCGAGGLLRHLARLGYTNLHGVDPSPVCVEDVSRIDGVTGHLGGLFAMPAEARGADVIALSHVLEHVRDVNRAIAGLRARLRAAGRLYIEVPDATRYAECMVVAFQDFNVEHINHFSATSLTTLLARHGLKTIATGQKTIAASQDVPYPAVWVIAERDDSAAAGALRHDDALRPAIERYIERSRAAVSAIDARLAHVLDGAGEIVVWGTGQTVRELLTATRLGTAPIAAFVDSNASVQGRRFAGAPVVSPATLPERSEPILVGSIVSQSAIVAQATALGVAERLLVLDPRPSAAST